MFDLCFDIFLQDARASACSIDVSKYNGYLRSLNNFTPGSSIFLYSLDKSISTSSLATSLQSTYSETTLRENDIANDRMVVVSLRLGTMRCFENTLSSVVMSKVTLRPFLSKKNDTLFLVDGKSITNNASIDIRNFLLGLLTDKFYENMFLYVN